MAQFKDKVVIVTGRPTILSALSIFLIIVLIMTYFHDETREGIISYTD